MNILDFAEPYGRGRHDIRCALLGFLCYLDLREVAKLYTIEGDIRRGREHTDGAQVHVADALRALESRDGLVGSEAKRAARAVALYGSLSAELESSFPDSDDEPSTEALAKELASRLVYRVLVRFDATADRK